MDGKDLKKKKSKGQLEAPPPPSLEFKVEILGPGSVGKSALLKQLCFGGFTDEYKPTMEDTYKKSLIIDGQTVILELVDTAGDEQIASRMQYDHKTPHAFVFVFSLVSKKSLEDVCAAYEAVQKERKDEFPCLLLGTKLDLASQRQVTAIEANALAAKWENCVYHEVTAKYPQEVTQAFQKLVRMLLAAAEKQRQQETAAEQRERGDADKKKAVSQSKLGKSTSRARAVDVAIANLDKSQSSASLSGDKVLSDTGKDSSLDKSESKMKLSKSDSKLGKSNSKAKIQTPVDPLEAVGKPLHELTEEEEDAIWEKKLELTQSGILHRHEDSDSEKAACCTIL